MKEQPTPSGGIQMWPFLATDGRRLPHPFSRTFHPVRELLVSERRRRRSFFYLIFFFLPSLCLLLLFHDLHALSCSFICGPCSDLEKMWLFRNLFSISRCSLCIVIIVFSFTGNIVGLFKIKSIVIIVRVCHNMNY